MNRQELTMLAAKLKQALSPYVSEERIRAVGGFLPGSDDLTLELRITIPGGRQEAAV